MWMSCTARSSQPGGCRPNRRNSDGKLGVAWALATADPQKTIHCFAVLLSHPAVSQKPEENYFPSLQRVLPASVLDGPPRCEWRPRASTHIQFVPTATVYQPARGSPMVSSTAGWPRQCEFSISAITVHSVKCILEPQLACRLPEVQGRSFSFDAESSCCGWHHSY